MALFIFVSTQVLPYWFVFGLHYASILLIFVELNEKNKDTILKSNVARNHVSSLSYFAGDRTNAQVNELKSAMLIILQVFREVLKIYHLPLSKFIDIN